MPLLVTAPYAQTAAGALKPPPDAREGTAATETWTDHLKITTSVSVPVAPPGDRVSLIAEIEPGARIHVYAPGADNYRVVTLTVAAHQGVRLLPMKYPASEIYFFEPLNERIPVFQQPFKMIQELILETGPKAQAAFRGKQRLTLSGTLDYQACDDRICFNPVSVPLSWTIALRPEATEPHGRTAAPR
jgi:hypothetical protein